ncbi:MAG: outer membrane lipoprotein-sorting protein [Flavobacteriaceae bacterium]
MKFKMMMVLAIALWGVQPIQAQLDATQLTELINKAENKFKGKSSVGESLITTIRPKYTREMRMKSWSLGDEYSLMYIMEPVRDKGTTYLKRDKEIWYYLPSIERNIKMPPSMMNQSWMGTDLSNDDLVKKTSLAYDFDHTLIGEESIDGISTYHIKLIPHKDADVIWGKVELWIEKEHNNIMKQQSFDEDMELVNSMTASKMKVMGGVYLPTILEFVPADKPNQKTVMEYISIKFNVDIPKNYFTTQYMTRVKA